MTSEVTFTEFVRKKEGVVNPVLVSFQNGEPIRDRISDLGVKLFPSKSMTNIEVTTSDGQKFISHETSSDVLPCNVIAIKNKKTNKVKLVEVDYLKVLNSVLTKKEEIQVVPSDYGKQNVALQKMFGGKRVVRKLELKEKLNVDSTYAEDDLKVSAAGVDVSENNEVQGNSESDSLAIVIPPCHRDARSVMEVYILPEIISEEEVTSALEEVQRVLQEDSLNKFSDLFNVCLSKVKKNGSDVNEKVAGLLFMNVLIDFIKLPAKKLKVKSLTLCSYSNLFHHKVLEEFCVTVDNNITRPLTHRDKAICYALVLSLICTDYQVDFKLLINTFGVQGKRMQQLLRTIGAVPLRNTDNYVLKLPLPEMLKSSKGRPRK